MDSNHTILQLQLDSTSWSVRRCLGWLSECEDVLDDFAKRIAFHSVLFANASMFDILALDFWHFTDCSLTPCWL